MKKDMVKRTLGWDTEFAILYPSRSNNGRQTPARFSTRKELYCAIKGLLIGSEFNPSNKFEISTSVYHRYSLGGIQRTELIQYTTQTLNEFCQDWDVFDLD